MTGTSTRPPTTLGQRAFHAGDDDDHARGGEAGVLGEQAVQPGDPDVVEPIDVVAHDLGGDRRFFGDRQVGGARRGDEDRAASARGGGRS